MSIIVVDGPEKAGKTTLIAVLARLLSDAGRSVSTVHWSGRAVPDDRVYTWSLQTSVTALQADAVTGSSPEVIIWDRSWASECVYGRLLRQGRRLASDPWLGEWLCGRAVQTNGLRVMLLGPEPRELNALRDGTDLPVNPAAEQRLYWKYAQRFSWYTPRQYEVDGHRCSPESIARRVLSEHEQALACPSPTPPVYCGPRCASVVVVGEARSGVHLAGQWLPFSSRLTTMLGRMLGDKALDVGWTNASDCPPSALRSARIIVACGVKARQWLDRTSAEWGGRARVVSIPHPAHAFRFNNAVTVVEQKAVQRAVTQLLKEI